MCGICGMISYSKNRVISETLIGNMCSKVFHRGPDEEGVFVKNDIYPSVGLGHRRLKIIDLSESASQPMSNEDGTILVVFNGEIYNFQELRLSLKGKGHKFKSQSDTEVIIHLYEEEGPDCVKRLRGMFAFAIWDSNSKLLLLARDRLGKKPLLYSYKNGIFIFASEFMSLIAGGNISKEINLFAIKDYLTFGYISAPVSIYKDIRKLLPGHILLLKDREIKIQRYWYLNYYPKADISFSDAKDKAVHLLEEAVKIRLNSDVPLGAFLSGGLDSSTIVALMHKYMPSGKVKTFSIGFDDKNFDELRYARIVAERLNTEHHEFIVKPDALGILPELVEHYGEPYADSSCVPTYYVANRTRQYVTVALNGDGGDELFAGYERYRAVYLSRWYNSVPYFIRKNIIEAAVNLIPYKPHTKNKIFRLRRFFKSSGLPIPDRYLRWVAFCDSDFQDKLYSKEFMRTLAGGVSQESIFLPFFNNGNDYELIDRLLSLDTNTYLPNDLLVKVDIAAMANSLEARSPFLDHCLVEFVASLKADYKMKWLIKKYLLKKIAKDFIPRSIIHRKKMGFGVPIGRWFRNELKGFLKETLLSSRSLKRGYFNPEFINAVVKQHTQGKSDHSPQLWALLMLELWHNRFIDNNA